MMDEPKQRERKPGFERALSRLAFSGQRSLPERTGLASTRLET